MVNLIGFLFGNFSVSVDFMLKDNFSVEGQIGVGFGDEFGLDYFNFFIIVYGKYYFNFDDGVDKFYVDVFLWFIVWNYFVEDSLIMLVEYS